MKYFVLFVFSHNHYLNLCLSRNNRIIINIVRYKSLVYTDRYIYSYYLP